MRTLKTTRTTKKTPESPVRRISRAVATKPYWSASAPFPRFSKLASNTSADVVVVGGGITGLTAAYLLARDGKRVVVLERARCASIDTGHTSAHLTMVTDVRVAKLAKQLGRNHAQAVWDAGLAAIHQIDEIARRHEIDAAFAWVDGYRHAPVKEESGAQTDGFDEDAAVASELGFDATELPSVPVMARPGVRFDSQARFHPGKYLAGVAKAVIALGGRIYESSEADEFVETPRCVKTGRHTVRCEDIVIATHNPLVGLAGVASATLFQTKLALYTSYVVAGRVPRDTVLDALWWDTADPYRYLRIEPQDDHDLLIFGGEDHKTGQEADPNACYERLEYRLAAIVPGVEFSHRWSGQVIETPDGLPYIGEMAEHQYAGTGYAGNGMTFGTLAAMMISDAILGRGNPWTELFDPSRKALTRGLWSYIKENADYPYYLVRDRFAGAEGRSLRSVKRGCGMVIEREGKKVAAYRNPAGEVTLRSATCTHMGCLVAWNPAEQTWDCPCHGSRFKTNGEVISGPAESPLSRVD